MRPRNIENRDLPPRVVRRKRKRKNGKVWVGYFYRDETGKEISLGTDFAQARLKWAQLEARERPADLGIMRGIFDRYLSEIIPRKAPRTQEDNHKELRQLRPVFDEAPIDAITPAMIAGYRDARTAKTRANRELALLSHVFNMAREWGLTDKQNPCQGVRKNKEKPRDYYANNEVWMAMYSLAPQELKDAMDLAYLTGQRPADVLAMRSDDISDSFFLVSQGKTGTRLRILLNDGGCRTSLGVLIDQIRHRNSRHLCRYLIINERGKRLSWEMLRNRWNSTRDKAAANALKAGDKLLAVRIMQFQFRDIRPKAASEILDIADASLLLGHSKEEITKRVYRRVGAIAKPAK